MCRRCFICIFILCCIIEENHRIIENILLHNFLCFNWKWVWGVKNCHHLFQFTSNKENFNITGFEWKINWHFPLCFTYTPRCWCCNEESIKKVEKFLIGHYLEKFSNGKFSYQQEKYIGKKKTKRRSNFEFILI